MPTPMFRTLSLSLATLFSLGLAACNSGDQNAASVGAGTTVTPSGNGGSAVGASSLKLADCAMIAKEQFLTRNDISSGTLNDKGKLMLRFVQFSDDHVIDDDGQATNGASFTDAVQPIFESAQRSQEEYSDEVLNNMVAAVNECHKQFPAEFMIVTGDSADLTTIAETRRFIDNLDGTFDQMSAFEETCRKGFPAGTPEPILDFSCTRFTGRGVADTQAEDIDVTNPALRTTLTRSIFQLQNTSRAVLSGRNAKGETSPTRQTFNRAAGLPEVLRCKEGDAGCENESLKMPWMIAFGNHDGYLRGTAAFGTGLNEASMATGRKHIQTQSDFIAEFFKSSSLPVGHGFNYADEARRKDKNLHNDGYYAFSSKDNQFRMIVLNTIIDGRDQRLPTDTVRNPMALADGTIDAELASYPNVIAWVAGHTHRHRVRAFAVNAQGMGDNGVVKVPVTCKSKTAAECKGFWQIEAASLIDFPQEQRLFEIIDNKDGTGIIRSPVIGHTHEKSKELAKYDDRCQFYFTDPASYQMVKSTEADLAGLCVFGGTRQGEAKDRNVNLAFKMPTFK